MRIGLHNSYCIQTLCFARILLYIVSSLELFGTAFLFSQTVLRTSDLDGDGIVERIQLTIKDDTLWLQVLSNSGILSSDPLVRIRPHAKLPPVDRSAAHIVDGFGNRMPLIVTIFDDPELLDKGLLFADMYDAMSQRLTRQSFFYGSDSEHLSYLVSNFSLFNIDSLTSTISFISGKDDYEDDEGEIISFYVIAEYRWVAKIGRYILVGTTLLEDGKGAYISSDVSRGNLESAFRKKFFVERKRMKM